MTRHIQSKKRILLWGINEADEQIRRELDAVAEVVEIPNADEEGTKANMKKVVAEHGPIDGFAFFLNPKYPMCKRWDADIFGPVGDTLKCFVTSSSGYNMVDYDWITSKGAYLANSPREMGIRTADGALMLLLATFRSLIPQNASIRSGGWADFQHPGINWRTQTIGIIGLGIIGKQVATMCTALGMKVIYNNRSPAKDSPFEYVSLDELYKRADVVMLHCPLTPETTHLINKESIAKMKDGVIIGNIARGPCIDEPALIEALESKKVARVFLDVYEKEPEIPQALRTNINATLFPHFTPGVSDIFQANHREVMENLIAFCKTGKPNTPVNEADLKKRHEA